MPYALHKARQDYATEGRPEPPFCAGCLASGGCLPICSYPDQDHGRCPRQTTGRRSLLTRQGQGVKARGPVNNSLRPVRAFHWTRPQVVARPLIIRSSLSNYYGRAGFICHAPVAPCAWLAATGPPARLADERAAAFRSGPKDTHLAIYVPGRHATCAGSLISPRQVQLCRS